MAEMASRMIRWVSDPLRAVPSSRHVLAARVQRSLCRGTEVSVDEEEELESKSRLRTRSMLEVDRMKEPKGRGSLIWILGIQSLFARSRRDSGIDWELAVHRSRYEVL